MTRQEGLLLLRGGSEVSYDALDGVFAAFGFRSASPSFETEVYYHPQFKCGKYTARDDGFHVLTEEQKGVVLQMLNCVVQHEQVTSR